MSLTRILCDGCGYPLAFCACEKPKAASERATSEPAGAAKVVAAVATGSGSASSAAVFEELNQMATDYEDIGQERTADTIRAVAEMYRRHAACTIPRQPRPNVPNEPQARSTLKI